MSSSSAENPGAAMAEAVNREIVVFRKLQEEVKDMEQTRQTLVSQQSENEMVLQELKLCDDSSVVYKMVGPVLMKNKLEEARKTIEGRLEFIGTERNKLEKSLQEKETKANETANKIREMQGAMQKAAVEAAQAAATAAKESSQS
jgi:prefoldin beta subunit